MFNMDKYGDIGRPVSDRSIGYPEIPKTIHAWKRKEEARLDE